MVSMHIPACSSVVFLWTNKAQSNFPLRFFLETLKTKKENKNPVLFFLIRFFLKSGAKNSITATFGEKVSMNRSVHMCLGTENFIDKVWMISWLGDSSRDYHLCGDRTFLTTFAYYNFGEFGNFREVSTVGWIMFFFPSTSPEIFLCNILRCIKYRPSSFCLSLSSFRRN